jgi:KDO2-lipid IV(A) lauroyltransferase
MISLADIGYQTGWVVIKRLPKTISRKLFQKIADVSYGKDIKGVQQLRANLSFMTDLKADSIELEQLVKDGMRSYLRYWEDAFRLPTWDKKNLNKYVICTGIDNLESALSTKKPLITATPHMGNWDAAGYWYTTNYGPLTTVVERLKPESIYKKFVKFRNSLGIEVIPTSGETDIFMKLLRRAKEGRMIALVADRDITKNGIEVNYGPGKTSFPVGPAAIAVALDGLVLPLSSYYNEMGVLVMHFFPALSPSGEETKEQRVQTLTQELASIFEKEIKKHPQDWHMLQRVWNDVLPMKRINQGLVN